jgi:hypothetical protein
VGAGDAMGGGGDGGLSWGTVTGFSNPRFVMMYFFYIFFEQLVAKSNVNDELNLTVLFWQVSFKS